MKQQKLIMAAILLLLMIKPVLALEHVQKDGLFSMDVPEAWHWNEFPGEVVIAYPDGKDAAMDIQMVPVQHLSPADIAQRLKENSDALIKQINAHGGTLIDQKMIKVDQVDASEVDFKTGQGADAVVVTYVSFFHQGEGFKITYGSNDVKTHAVLDDVIASIKF